MVMLLLNHENCFQYLVNRHMVVHTHLGSKMIANLILTYGMATRVRRLPVSPTVITSVLFKANPSLPSVIS